MVCLASTCTYSKSDQIHEPAEDVHTCLPCSKHMQPAEDASDDKDGGCSHRILSVSIEYSFNNDVWEAECCQQVGGIQVGPACASMAKLVCYITVCRC